MTPTNGWMACVRLGLSAAWRRRGLVVLVWALFLIASLLAVAPAWRWWSSVLAMAPEGDRLLDGLNAPLLRELSHYDRSPTYLIALGSVASFMLAALIANPFVAGGLIAVLRTTSETSRDLAGGQPLRFSVWREFFRRAAGHYWLFLRLLLFAGVLGGVLAIVLVLPVVAIRHIADINDLESLFLISTFATPVPIVIAICLASLVLDFARIRAVHLGEQRVWRAFRGGLGFVWRNAFGALAIGLTFAVLMAITFAIYFTVSASFTPKTSFLILIAIVWQQLLSLTRTGLRVAMVAGELELVQARDQVLERRLEVVTPVATAAPLVRDLPPLA